MKKSILTSKKFKVDDGSHWLSISDLMSGLMIVFLFIAISYMYNIHQIAKDYKETKKSIYEALYEEFKADLNKSSWGASIDPETLTITFNAPNVQFDSNKADLKVEYQEVLSDFFPRYMNVLSKFKKDVQEIRIEGHTSSIWNDKTTPQEAYFNNMKLSQDRTRSVLQYVFNLPEVEKYRDWMKKQIAAVGFSSAHVILDKENQEDYSASRRVSFRVLTNAENSIDKILKDSQ